MKKSTKGALAAAAAGTMLLGGTGSLAFWSDSKTVTAGSISSGSISLTDVTCASTWSHTEGLGGTVTKIVPGDTITKQCTGTLSLVGDHIGATVALDKASIKDTIGTLVADGVTAEAVMTSPSATVTAAGDYDVTIDINVAFPDTIDTVTSQGATATLDDLQLVATQTHQ